MLSLLLSSPVAAASRDQAGKGSEEPGTCQDPDTQSWVPGLQGICPGLLRQGRVQAWVRADGF